MNIKTLILMIINGLILLVISSLSFSFFNQFSSVLNDRILMQLNSIETLETIQIQNYINNEWERFSKSDQYNTSLFNNDLALPDSIKRINGIHDFTPFHPDKKVINVEKDLTSTGGSAVDVVGNIPSITVDLDGNVSFR